MNGVQARVSDITAVAESVFAMDLGYDDQLAGRQLALVTSIWPGMQSLRVTGSAGLSLAYVAAGRYDLYLQPNLFPWDLAPGILHVEEAGGVVTDRQGNPVSIFSTGIIAAAPGLHAEVLALASAFERRE